MQAPAQKYTGNQHPIEVILAWVKSEEIAIPEIQRPFVGDSTKVCDLMDALYKGYPAGDLILWKTRMSGSKTARPLRARKSGGVQKSLFLRSYTATAPMITSKTPAQNG